MEYRWDILSGKSLRTWKRSSFTFLPQSSYAMNLFRIQPLDFLIKPISREMTEDIMERSLRMYERKKIRLFPIVSKVTISMSHFVRFYISTVRTKKVSMVLKEEEVQFYGKLKEISKSVPHNFMMIHQSFLINLDYVSECSYELVKWPMVRC